MFIQQTQRLIWLALHHSSPLPENAVREWALLWDPKQWSGPPCSSSGSKTSHPAGTGAGGAQEWPGGRGGHRSAESQLLSCSGTSAKGFCYVFSLPSSGLMSLDCFRRWLELLHDWAEMGPIKLSFCVRACFKCLYKKNLYEFFFLCHKFFLN